MPRKGPSTSKADEKKNIALIEEDVYEDEDMEDDDDEWEEQIMVAQVDGVLDAQMLRNAVEDGRVCLQRANSNEPILQIGTSLYTGQWSRTLGTNLLFQTEPAGQQALKLLSVNNRMLKAEKALLIATESPLKGKTSAEKSTAAKSK